MADRSTDEIRAELRAAELVEQLIEAKADEDFDPAELAQLKLDTREARRVFRELRAARGADPGSVRPDTIDGSGEVQEV